MSSASEKPAYVIPRYWAEGDVPFHHVLFGAVPGHHIDFLYCPEVPQGALRQTHIGHLARILKYVEPRPGAEHAFAIGNLSRDDVQHEPGHGGLVLLLAQRVQGVTDHAGRKMVPFAHGLVAVDRALDRATLLEAATTFHRSFSPAHAGRDRRRDFYREYVRALEKGPGAVAAFLAREVGSLTDLPRPPRSDLAWDYVADEDAPPRRVVVVHDTGEELAAILRVASAIGAVLYRSDIKWTSISTGRDLDVSGGTTVRFVPRNEAPSDEDALVVQLGDVPDDDDAIAELLFGMRRRGSDAPRPPEPWQAEYGAPRSGPAAVTGRKAPATLPAALPPPALAPAKRRAKTPGNATASAPAGGPPKGNKGAWVGAVTVIAAAAGVVALTLSTVATPPPPAAPGPDREPSPAPPPLPLPPPAPSPAVEKPAAKRPAEKAAVEKPAVEKPAIEKPSKATGKTPSPPRSSGRHAPKAPPPLAGGPRDWGVPGK